LPQTAAEYGARRALHRPLPHERAVLLFAGTALHMRLGIDRLFCVDEHRPGLAGLGINGQKITTLPVFSQKRLTLFFVALDRDEFGLNSSKLVHGDAPQQGV